MMRTLLILLVLVSAVGSLLAADLAQVGPYTITSNDVGKLKKQLIDAGVYTKDMTNELLLQRLIDAKLVIMDARNQAIDKEEGAKDAAEAALYSYYIKKVVDGKLKNKKFNNKEELAYYKSNPLVKIQRLTYSFDPNDKKSVNKAKAEISILRSEIKSKKLTFDAAIENNSEYQVQGASGVFDKVPLLALPQIESMQVKNLQPMELSPVITFQNFFAVTRLIKIYPFSQEYSEATIKEQAWAKERDNFIQTLRQKYATLLKENK